MRILLLFSMISFCCFAENKIPLKLLRNISVKTDEFTGITKYSADNCCLSLEKHKDSTTLYISLACRVIAAPAKLHTIYILAGGNVTQIAYDENTFSHRETSERYMRTGSSGKFGTSGYRSAEFDSRVVFVDEWKSVADEYMDEISTIIKTKRGKIKFEGSNDTFIQDIKLPEIEKMRNIVGIYEILKAAH